MAMSVNTLLRCFDAQPAQAVSGAADVHMMFEDLFDFSSSEMSVHRVPS